jgi:hypothetical protein
MNIAVTYLHEKAKQYAAPLAEALRATIVMPLDVAVRLPHLDWTVCGGKVDSQECLARPNPCEYF